MSIIKHILRALPAILWIMVVSYFSFFYVGKKGLVARIPHFDKMAHFVFYGVLTPLSFFFLIYLFHPVTKALCIAFLLSWLIGGVFELLQWKVFIHRDASIGDQAANMLGAICCALLLSFPAIKRFYFRIIGYTFPA